MRPGALDLKAHVHILGAVPSGLPHIGLPEIRWSWELIQKLVPTAFAMFVVILAQSAATSPADSAYALADLTQQKFTGDFDGMIRRRYYNSSIHSGLISRRRKLS
jgi:MFS superfamily sulfate permease-like transporter